MFINKLNKQDIEKFLTDNIKMDIEEIELHEDQIYVRLGFNDTQVVEFLFKDFEVVGQNIFAKAGQDIVEEKWLYFMSNKFDYKLNMFGRLKRTGEYTTARLNYIKNKNSGRDC